MWFVHKSDHEVSGFGSLDFNPETGIFTVKDAILLKQEVGPTSTEIDPVALGKAMFELKDKPNALKWHWHSHVDMGVFWSGDDRTLIKNLGSQGWIVASVFNKKREIKSAFYAVMDVSIMSLAPQKKEIFLEDIDTKVQRYIDGDLAEAWDAEYDEHVTARSNVYSAYGNYGSSSYSAGTSNLKGFVKKAVRDIDHLKDVPQFTKNQMGEYDERGYRWSIRHDRFVYNPLYDEMINGNDNEVVAAIFTMDSDEVESADLYWKDQKNEFRRLYNKAVAIMATKNKSTKGLKASGEKKTKNVKLVPHA